MRGFPSLVGAILSPRDSERLLVDLQTGNHTLLGGFGQGFSRRVTRFGDLGVAN